MILADLGIERSQERLARQLGLRPHIGVPAFHITRLQSAQIAVTYDAGTFQTITTNLANNTPVIAFVQAGELPQWRGHRFQHAVIVVGVEPETIHLIDPAVETHPLSVLEGDFLLAWDELDYLYAILTRRRGTSG